MNYEFLTSSLSFIVSTISHQFIICNSLINLQLIRLMKLLTKQNLIKILHINVVLINSMIH